MVDFLLLLSFGFNGSLKADSLPVHVVHIEAGGSVFP